MMRALILSLALLCGSAQAQLSQERPSQDRLAAAMELLEAGQITRQIDATLGAMRQTLLANLRSASPTLSDAERLRALDEFILPDLRAHVGAFTEETIAIWAGHLTVEEMRAMRDFHRSPLGQRMLEVQLRINAAINIAATAWAQRVVNTALARHRETLRARGFTL